MSERNPRRAECPICGRVIATFAAGDLRTHGSQGNRCLGSRQTPEQAARCMLPCLTSGQVAMLRECWRIGDWRPVEREFGITFHGYNPRGATPEEELADLVNGVREWIATLAELSQTRAERRVP